MNTLEKLKGKILTEASYASGRYLVPPQFVSIILTLRCNFRCPSCSIWRLPPEKNALSKNEWLATVDSLTHTLPSDTFIEVNGGEALLEHTLALSVIRQLKQHFRRVTLNSNGSLFTKERVANLKRAGLDAVKLSLYALNKNIHDELRGHAGAFDSASTAMKLLAEGDIETEVGVLVTSKNIQLIPDLAVFLNKKRIRVILQPLDESIEGIASKNMRKNEILHDLWPSKSDVDHFFDWTKKNYTLFKNPANVLETMRRYYLNPQDILSYRCFSGQRTLIIYPNGNVTLCFKRGAIGNAKNSSIQTILSGKSARTERKGITHCQKYCRIVGCNFSRGFPELIHDFFQKM